MSYSTRECAERIRQLTQERFLLFRTNNSEGSGGSNNAPLDVEEVVDPYAVDTESESNHSRRPSPTNNDIDVHNNIDNNVNIKNAPETVEAPQDFDDFIDSQVIRDSTFFAVK